MRLILCCHFLYTCNMVWYDIVLYIVFLTPKFLNTFVNVLTVSLIYILFFRVKSRWLPVCVFLGTAWHLTRQSSRSQSRSTQVSCLLLEATKDTWAAPAITSTSSCNLMSSLSFFSPIGGSCPTSAAAVFLANAFLQLSDFNSRSSFSRKIKKTDKEIKPKSKGNRGSTGG